MDQNVSPITYPDKKSDSLYQTDIHVANRVQPMNAISYRQIVCHLSRATTLQHRAKQYQSAEHHHYDETNRVLIHPFGTRIYHTRAF